MKPRPGGAEQDGVLVQTRGRGDRHHQHPAGNSVKTEVSRMQLDPRQLEESGITLPILIELTMGIAMVDTGSRTSLIDICEFPQH